MAYISLRGVAREFADNTGLHATDLDINQGEFISIVGPSGCGKSTLLRCIAGLERPDSGTIVLAGREVFSAGGKAPLNLSVNKRNLSMVFQDLALWPHMTVEKNIEFPLTTKGGGGGRNTQAAVQQAMDMVGIADKAKARPAQLSGGQQQRVAIARALVSNPDILLMDEPLSALDAALRVQIRAELTSLARELNLTVIYVTHDQAEALAMSDRIVVMNKGSVEQFADPVTLYEQPGTDFVAGFVGIMNHHPQLGSVRPENVEVHAGVGERDVGTSPHALRAEVVDAHYVGGRYELRCAVEGALDPWTAYSIFPFTSGDTVLLSPHFQSISS